MILTNNNNTFLIEQLRPSQTIFHTREHACRPESAIPRPSQCTSSREYKELKCKELSRAGNSLCASSQPFVYNSRLPSILVKSYVWNSAGVQLCSIAGSYRQNGKDGKIPCYVANFVIWIATCTSTCHDKALQMDVQMFGNGLVCHTWSISCRSCKVRDCLHSPLAFFHHR